MKREYFNFYKVSLICIFALMLTLGMGTKQANSYYGGSLYGGAYGGLYGSSLYGGAYGGLYGGLYGGGLYGGSLYGGLYGSSLYGGGLYGGGLYGGLYGGGLYGGLYGGSYASLYGGGLYGGLYGSTTNPFGLQNMYYTIQTGSGLSYQVPFLQIAPLLGVAGLYNNLFPSLFNSGYDGRIAQQVITTLYDALLADPLLGPVLLADPVALDLLAADANLAAVVAANALWLTYHAWQVLPPNIPTAQPLLLSTMAVSCTACHANVNTGTLLPVVPLPTAL